MSDDLLTRLFVRFLQADERPPRAPDALHADVVVPRPLEATFAFFADAANLERLTPPWLNFEILTARPITMRAGAEIDYRIRLYGVSIPWKTRIDVWEPGVRFVDRQLAGPYRWWRHEHRFEPADNGTRVIDTVEYVPRLAWLTGRKVRTDVSRIFAYRREALLALFGD